jgi:hypothetical protein
MRRWLLPLVSAISIILCLLLLYTWIRSYLPRYSRLDNNNGRLLILLWDGKLPDDPMWQVHNPDNEQTFELSRLFRQLRRKSDRSWLGFQYTTGSVAGYLDMRILAIPIWFPILLTTIPPAIWLISTRRQRRRKKSNQCLSCGYDLRASKDKCPECGTPIPVLSPSPT